MYLSQIVIINYRSCNKLTINFLKDDPNVFIGINDCGKTSILKAIGLLLDEKIAYHFIKENSSKSDFSNSPISVAEFKALLSDLKLPDFEYNAMQTIVFGRFKFEEGELDAANKAEYSNTLIWALENSEEDEVWLAKSFESRSNNNNVFILSKDYLDGDGKANRFFTLGVTELNRRIKEFSVTDSDIKNENGKGRFSNLEKVRALYNKRGSLSSVWCEYKIEKADRDMLPIYRYLDWNASLDEIKKVATDALNVIIESYLAPLKKQAGIKADKAQTAVNKKLTDLQKSIAELVPNVTALKTKVYFDVKESITDILINKRNGDGDIHLDLQGEGVKRQIWFALIKTGALANIESKIKTKKFIWAFDEPETHLYPTAQRQFFDVIKQVSKTTVQTFISTHSTVFIDRSNIDSIKSVYQNTTSYTEYSECTSIDQIFSSLELRNSDFLFFDKFLIIEGDTEEHLIPALYKIYTGRNLLQDNIQLVNLGGKSKWLEAKRALESVLNGFKKSLDYVVYLFDSDMKFDLGAGAIRDTYFFVGKQDIEDSLNNAIWISIVKEFTEGKVKLKNEDIDKIKDQIPDNHECDNKVKFMALLERKVKEELSIKLAEKVTWNVLPSKGTDSTTAILKYLNKKSQIPLGIVNAFDKLLKIK